jgi:hypothetical protein
MVNVDENGITTEAPEIAQELGKRIVGGLLRAARVFVPTRDNLEGKKVHCDVSLMNGAIYVGTDHSTYMAVIRPKLAELCKKKSPLRTATEELGDNYSALLNYGAASPWLKLHEKNIKSASIGPNGIKLVVADGLVELDMSPTAASTEYAEEVAQTVETRVLEENLEMGPITLGDPPSADLEVLTVSATAAEYVEFLVTDPPIGTIQMKFKPGALPGGECEVRVYADPEGGKIVRITTDGPLMHVDQFFRVLSLSE